jgi:hypothetical protein
MLINFKALVVVLFCAGAVFLFARPLCLRFMAEQDFARRRNIWFTLTIAAFASPSFWLFLLLAFPLLVWGGRKDTNPIALYVLVMHLFPPSIAVPIPTIGDINEFFDLTNYRILNLAILVPIAWRLMHTGEVTDNRVRRTMDFLIVSYVTLQVVLLMPYESITNTLRRGVLHSLDFLLLYYVVSRVSTSRNAIVETMASFCLACAIFAPLALVEAVKGWPLYQGIGENWGSADPFLYLVRNNILRASVSAGHAIPLGFLMAVGLGFWLYLATRVLSLRLTFTISLLMIVGLLSAYSRAPWLVAFVLYFSYRALSPNGATKVLRSLLLSIPIITLILVSPIGHRVIDNLPFIGTVNADTVSYREQLAVRSWELIKQNPYFGDPFFMLKLESLRQGQGIIDLMNAYAAIAMNYGLVALSLLLGFFMIGMLNTLALSRSTILSDPDYSTLGAILVACMAGTLFMMATGGLGMGVAQTFYLLTGFAAGYAQIDHRPESDKTGPAGSGRRKSD